MEAEKLKEKADGVRHAEDNPTWTAKDIVLIIAEIIAVIGLVLTMGYLAHVYIEADQKRAAFAGQFSLHSSEKGYC